MRDLLLTLLSPAGVTALLDLALMQVAESCKSSDSMEKVHDCSLSAKTRKTHRKISGSQRWVSSKADNTESPKQC